MRERNAKTAQTAGASCRGCEFFISLNITVQEINYAADGTANVVLLVKDIFNNTVENATVNVSEADAIYMTGREGTVIVYNLGDGHYNATASKECYVDDTADFRIRYEVKIEPAVVPEQLPPEEGAMVVLSEPTCPWIVLLLLLVIFYLWWIRRKKKGQEDKAQQKPIEDDQPLSWRDIGSAGGEASKPVAGNPERRHGSKRGQKAK